MINALYVLKIAHCPLTKAQYFFESFHMDLTLSLLSLRLSQVVDMTSIRLITDKFQIINFAPILLFTGVFTIGLNPRPIQRVDMTSTRLSLLASTQPSIPLLHLILHPGLSPDFRTRRGKFPAPKVLGARGVWGHTPKENFEI